MGLRIVAGVWIILSAGFFLLVRSAVSVTKLVSSPAGATAMLTESVLDSSYSRPLKSRPRWSLPFRLAS